jgi:hypothetical protein
LLVCAGVRLHDVRIGVPNPPFPSEQQHYLAGHLNIFKRPFIPQETGTLAILSCKYRIPASPAYPPPVRAIVRVFGVYESAFFNGFVHYTNFICFSTAGVDRYSRVLAIQPS